VLSIFQTVCKLKSNVKRMTGTNGLPADHFRIEPLFGPNLDCIVFPNRQPIGYAAFLRDCQIGMEMIVFATVSGKMVEYRANNGETMMKPYHRLYPLAITPPSLLAWKHPRPTDPLKEWDDWQPMDKFDAFAPTVETLSLQDVVQRAAKARQP